MTTQLDITKCKYYKNQEWFHGCTAPEELNLHCNCKDTENKHCPFRVEYYKNHPETYIQFGKYKYTEYKDIPNSYAAWLLKQDNLDKQVRKYIEDAIVEMYREDIISNFISDNYSERRNSYSSSSYCSGGSYQSGSYCGSGHCGSGHASPDYDYGGDLFDAMQGCCGNGF